MCFTQLVASAVSLLGVPSDAFPALQRALALAGTAGAQDGSSAAVAASTIDQLASLLSAVSLQGQGAQV